MRPLKLPPLQSLEFASAPMQTGAVALVMLPLGVVLVPTRMPSR